jgi:hypothetical protein
MDFKDYFSPSGDWWVQYHFYTGGKFEGLISSVILVTPPSSQNSTDGYDYWTVEKFENFLQICERHRYPATILPHSKTRSDGETVNYPGYNVEIFPVPGYDWIARWVAPDGQRYYAPLWIYDQHPYYGRLTDEEATEIVLNQAQHKMQHAAKVFYRKYNKKC